MNNIEQAAVGKGSSLLGQEQEVVIDLKGLGYALIKKWWLIMAVAIVGSVIGYISVDQAVKTSYSGNITMYVTANPGEERKLGVSDITAADKLIPNYIELIKNSQVLSGISKETGEAYSTQIINNMLNVSKINETGIFMVKITGSNEEAVDIISHAAAKAVPAGLMSILPVGNIRVIDDIEFTNNIYSNDPARNTLIGCLGGGALVCLVVLLSELLKNPVRNEKDLERDLGIISLGSVPKYKVSNKKIKKLRMKSTRQQINHESVQKASQDIAV